MLLRFQRKNLIETSSSSNDSDGNSKDDILTLMEHKNPQVKLAVFGKLKKMVGTYKHEKLKNIDRRLLRGLFLRNLKDFDEDQRENGSKMSLLARLT